MRTAQKIAGVVLLLSLLVYPASAMEITWQWDAPTTGSPVVFYEFQQSVDGGAWTTVGTPATTEISYDMADGSTVVRVRGVDEFGRAGPWATSDPFVDEGAPGGCGNLRWAHN